MRLRVVLAALGPLVTALVGADVALAEDMDTALARLRIDTGAAALPVGCTATGANGLPRTYCPDNDAWHRLMTEQAGVLLQALPGTARTTGPAGFRVMVGGSLVSIREDEPFWRLGTEGDQTSLASENAAPAGQLLVPTVEVRKGLPFGLELGAAFGHVMDTSTWVVGGHLQWAFVEGRTDWVPDVAVRGAFRGLVGGPEFSMVSPQVDLIVSKPLVVDGAWVVSPLVAFGLAWVFAESSVVDFTPEVDAYAMCVPDPTSSELACTSTDPNAGADFNNEAKFDDHDSMRMRLTAGAEARFSHFLLSGAFSFDLVAPNALGGSPPDDVSRQWSATLATGMQF